MLQVHVDVLMGSWGISRGLHCRVTRKREDFYAIKDSKSPLQFFLIMFHPRVFRECMTFRGESIVQQAGSACCIQLCRSLETSWRRVVKESTSEVTGAGELGVAKSESQRDVRQRGTKHSNVTTMQSTPLDISIASSLDRSPGTERTALALLADKRTLQKSFTNEADRETVLDNDKMARNVTKHN